MTKGPFVAVDDIVIALSTVRAADVVQVVRCADCQYCDYREGELPQGEIIREYICVKDSCIDEDGSYTGFFTVVDPAHYCASGERRIEDDGFSA